MAITAKTFIRSVVTVSIFAALSACGGGGGGDGAPVGEDSNGSVIPPPQVSHLAEVCPNIIDLAPGMNIKYKSQNVHGGRGPSFIMGCEPNAKQYWPISSYLATFPIYSALGNEIGRFVVYDPGHRPYGNRSYTGLPGGYPGDSSTLTNSALVDGGTEIYINVKSNICFKVNSPLVDQGAVGAISGSGGC